jgi:NADPH:quinone reductase-like Zn-dependent oxidoreductase
MKIKKPKIVRFHEIGNAEVLKMESLPILDPKEGEVRIKVEALGINRAEIMLREGKYLEDPVFPSRLGYEASGVVDAVGPDVISVKIGDKISTIPAFSMVQYGVYGESAIVPENAVAKYPRNLSSIEGTSIWMAYVTAYGAIVEIGNVQKNDYVLITASSSSVGLASIQMAKAQGTIVIATTRGADKKQFLLDAGADYVIVTDNEDLTERISAITNKKGVNLIFDPIAGSMLETLAEAASIGGMIIEYGALASDATPFPLFSALKKGLTFRGYTLFEITTDSEKLAKAKKYIFKGLQNESLKPIVDRIFPFEKIIEAHKFMESNQQKGKIVVKI